MLLRAKNTADRSFNAQPRIADTCEGPYLRERTHCKQWHDLEVSVTAKSELRAEQVSIGCDSCLFEVVAMSGVNP